MKEYDVFISYSRRDYVDHDNEIKQGNIVSQIKDLFQRNSISYWFDEEGIYSGDDFAPILAQAIKNSKIFLFISSENSNESEWTSGEIAVAHVYKKKIIPFRVDATPYNYSVILYIAKLDYIDYSANHEKAFIRLLKSVNDYLMQLAENEQDEEKKNKEVEALRKRKELDYIKERVLRITKDMEDAKNNWQLLVTQYNDLKSREASLLGVEYIPKKSSCIGLIDETRNTQNIVKQRLQKIRSLFKHWFYGYSDENKFIIGTFSVINIVCLGICAVSLYFIIQGIGYSRNVVVWLIIYFSAMLNILMGYLAKKKKRLALYILLLMYLPLLYVPPIPIGLFLLIFGKYRGQNYFSQTENVKSNLKDRQFWVSVIYTIIIMGLSIVLFWALSFV